MILAEVNKKIWRLVCCVALAAGFIFLQTAAPAVAAEPPVGSNFALEVGGALFGYFTSVSGIGSESEVIEHKVVDDKGNEIIIKIPGRLRWLDIIFHRGITSDLSIWLWRQQVIDGDINAARKNCTIIALDRSYNQIARWNVVNAWPMKVSGPIADLAGTEFMVEELILVHEGVERAE